MLIPFLAAFCVAALTALMVKHNVTEPGLRAMIAALVVFIPGVALTTSFLELTEGQMIAGSSRLVWSAMQLGLLAFGIVAGVEAVGVPASRVFSSTDTVLGSWAPCLVGSPRSVRIAACRVVRGMDRSGGRGTRCSAGTRAASSGLL